MLRSRKKDKPSRSRVAGATQAALTNPRVTDQTLMVANSLPDRLMADVLMHCESGISDASGVHSEPQLPPSLQLPPDDGDMPSHRNHTGESTTPRGSDDVARSCRDDGANSPSSPNSASLMRRLSSVAKRLGSGSGGGSQKRISLDRPLPASPGVSIIGNAARPPGAVCARYDIHHTATESECAPARTPGGTPCSFELSVVCL
jgi:hypothetical protein